MARNRRSDAGNNERRPSERRTSPDASEAEVCATQVANENRREVAIKATIVHPDRSTLGGDQMAGSAWLWPRISTEF